MPSAQSDLRISLLFRIAKMTLMIRLHLHIYINDNLQYP